MRPLKVLLVEDSRLICDRLRESISMMPGMSVARAVDNQVEALAMLKQSRVDVVLLDLHLRHGTGFGVLRAISKW
jgi:two-component system OmpR family response regulator